MLSFQNRAPDIKLLKKLCKSRRLSLPRKKWFLMKVHFEILRPPLDLWRRNESGVWSQFLILSLGWSYKQNEAQLHWQFTDCLKKSDFLQTNLNIGILYTIGNHFSPRLIILDFYLKIRLRLARIICQSFVILHEKVCQQFRYFCHEGEVSLRRGGHKELFCTQRQWWGWSETSLQHREATAWPRVLHTPPPLWVGFHGADPHPLGVLWSCCSSTCSPKSHLVVDRTRPRVHGFRERNKKDTQRERETRRWQEEEEGDRGRQTEGKEAGWTGPLEFCRC